jgi:YVTN family beta-propeller protein
MTRVDSMASAAPMALRARRVALGLLLLIGSAAWAAPKAYVGNFKDNTVSVIDTARAEVVATIPVAEGPHGMVLSLDGARLYVSGDGSSLVSVIDTATDRVTGTLPVGRAPHGLGLTPDGRRLLVAVYGEDRVAVFDTATAREVGSVPVLKPHTIAIRPDGRTAYVASQSPGAFSLAVIDLVKLERVRELPQTKPPRDLEFAFDGRALYFTLAGENAVQVLDPRTDAIVARVPTGASPHIASLFRGAAAGVAVVQGPGEVTLFDPSTHAALRSIAVGKQPHWVAAVAGGGTLYVTNEGSNDVSIVDVAAGTTRTVAVGNAPRKVVVQQVAAGVKAAAVMSIANFAFAPAEVVIEQGQAVTWRNDDGAPHGLTFGDGFKGADLLLPGATFTRTFDRAGRFDVACSVHPYMTAKVIVQAR